MNQKKKTKSATRRQLINQYLPFEIYAYATARYYAQLQEEGLIDVVEIMMHIEGIEEEEALARCIQMLKDLQTTHADFVAICVELLGQDKFVEGIANELNRHHKNN